VAAVYQLVIRADRGSLLEDGANLFTLAGQIFQASLAAAVLTVTLLAKDRRETGSADKGSFWTVAPKTSNAQFSLQDGVRRFGRRSGCSTGCCS